MATKPLLHIKWSKKLINSGFVAVPAFFLRSYRKLKPALSDFEVIFCVNLTDYIRSEKPAYPSWQRIARDLDVDVERIHETVESLSAKGYIEIHQLEGDRGEITGYQIDGLRRALEKLMDDEDSSD